MKGAALKMKIVKFYSRGYSMFNASVNLNVRDNEDDLHFTFIERNRNVFAAKSLNKQKTDTFIQYLFRTQSSSVQAGYLFNIGLMPDIMSSQISDGSNENKNGDAIVLQDRAVPHISTLPTRALFSFFCLRDINKWDENESSQVS